MVVRKFPSPSAKHLHPSGRVVVVVSTILALLLISGIVVAVIFLAPRLKPPEVKEEKKTETPVLTPRILHDPSPSPASIPRRQTSEPRK